MRAQGENKSSQWLEFLDEIFKPDIGDGFYMNLLQDVYLKEFFLSLTNTNKNKENLKNRINKYKDLSFTLPETETTESDQLTIEELVNNELIRAFIKVNNAKAELDKKAEGVVYKEKQGDGEDSYNITLTKEKHTISIPDKETGELYTAVFQKKFDKYTMTIERTGIDGEEIKEDQQEAFKKMQHLVKTENHEVTLMVNGKQINLFNQDHTINITSINELLKKETLLTTTECTAVETATATCTAVDTAAGRAGVGASESSLSWSDWIKGAVVGGTTGATVGAGAGFLAAGAIAGIAVAATAPISLPMIVLAGAGAGALAGAGAGLLSGIKTQNEEQGDAGFCKIATDALAPSAAAGGVAGLATGAGAIAGAVAAHGALGTGAFATVATSHAACVSTGASAAVRIIGNTAIAYSKGEASLSKFGIDAGLAAVGIGGGEAVFSLSSLHLPTESLNLAIGRSVAAVFAELAKYNCQKEEEKKPWALLLSVGGAAIGAAFSMGAAEFGAADNLRHVGESPSQHHNLLENMQMVFGRGDYDQIKECQEHLFKIFGLGECNTNSVLNLEANQDKIDNFLKNNPSIISNISGELHKYLNQNDTTTERDVDAELNFMFTHKEDIVALDNFFASDTTNTDGEKLSLLEQLKVVNALKQVDNALKQVDPDFKLETTTTFDYYFQEHKSIITQAMGYNCSNPHPITSQDFCNLLLKTGGEEEFQNSLNHLVTLQAAEAQAAVDQLCTEQQGIEYNKPIIFVDENGKIIGYGMNQDGEVRIEVSVHHRNTVTTTQCFDIKRIHGNETITSYPAGDSNGNDLFDDDQRRNPDIEGSIEKYFQSSNGVLLSTDNDSSRLTAFRDVTHEMRENYHVVDLTKDDCHNLVQSKVDIEKKQIILNCLKQSYQQTQPRSHCEPNGAGCVVSQNHQSNKPPS